MIGLIGSEDGLEDAAVDELPEVTESDACRKIESILN